MALLALLALLGCRSEAPRDLADPGYETARDEAWRPQVHVSPQANWLNDPNGLVWFDGEYHLFYQYNPASSVWGAMHWGHAVSPDLLHWQELDVALAPDAELGMAFSGTALGDPGNDSGLCDRDAGCILAWLTHVGGTDDTQKQSLAIGDDGGRSWRLYDGNPVVANPGERDFRDPKVFAYRGRWIMVLAVGDHVSLYESKDQVDWTWLSDFGPGGLDDGVWECPDLLKFQVDGREHWVLQVDVNPGGPAGGSGAAWFLGDFDGTRFDGELQGYVDHGADFYAAWSWNDLPDNRTVVTAWMSNWQYAAQTPTDGWRGALTFPREWSLVRRSGRLRLAQQPIAELASLRRSTPIDVRGKTVKRASALLDGFTGDLYEVEAVFDVTGAQSLDLGLFVGAGEQTVVSWRPGELAVDRSMSGDVDFHGAFGARHTAEVHDDGVLDLRILVDRSSVEVFAQGGTTVFTEQVFPASGRGLSLRSEGPVTVRSLRVHRLDSIW